MHRCIFVHAPLVDFLCSISIKISCSHFHSPAGELNRVSSNFWPPTKWSIKGTNRTISPLAAGIRKFRLLCYIGCVFKSAIYMNTDFRIFEKFEISEDRKCDWRNAQINFCAWIVIVTISCISRFLSTFLVLFNILVITIRYWRNTAQEIYSGFNYQ